MTETNHSRESIAGSQRYGIVVIISWTDHQAVKLAAAHDGGLSLGIVLFITVILAVVITAQAADANLAGWAVLIGSANRRDGTGSGIWDALIEVKAAIAHRTRPVRITILATESAVGIKEAVVIVAPALPVAVTGRAKSAHASGDALSVAADLATGTIGIHATRSGALAGEIDIDALVEIRFAIEVRGTGISGVTEFPTACAIRVGDAEIRWTTALVRDLAAFTKTEAGTAGLADTIDAIHTARTVLGSPAGRRRRTIQITGNTLCYHGIDIHAGISTRANSTRASAVPAAVHTTKQGEAQILGAATFPIGLAGRAKLSGLSRYAGAILTALIGCAIIVIGTRSWSVAGTRGGQALIAPRRRGITGICRRTRLVVAATAATISPGRSTFADAQVIVISTLCRRLAGRTGSSTATGYTMPILANMIFGTMPTINTFHAYARNGIAGGIGRQAVLIAGTP